MEANLITNLLLPLALSVIMFGLGLHLQIADFTRVAKMPQPVLVGLVTQMIVLPPLAFVLCIIFSLPPALSVGLMLLAASPGGATANVFSHLARGDVALNITLTAVNSLLILITLPVIVQWSMGHFLGAQAYVPPPFQKIIEVAAIILLPVAIGIWVREAKPHIAEKMERVIKPLSLLILLALIVLAVIKERELIVTHGFSVGWVCLILNLLSLSVGYGVARLMKLQRRQAIAIAFEIGIHNSTIAIFIALNVLSNSAFSIPAALYSLVMYLTAVPLAWWFRKSSM